MMLARSLFRAAGKHGRRGPSKGVGIKVMTMAVTFYLPAVLRSG
jgi:hypothetical protein